VKSYNRANPLSEQVWPMKVAQDRPSNRYRGAFYGDDERVTDFCKT
jgi:hypothetical protein